MYQAHDTERSPLLRSRTEKSSSWTKYALVTLAVTQVLTCMSVFYVLSELSAQRHLQASPVSAFDSSRNGHADRTGRHSHHSHHRHERETFSVGGVRASEIDVDRLAVPYVTPYQDQHMRGTCWDFATIGILEQSYRQQGVEQGFLQPDEYVQLSQQAYGVTVLRECRQNEHYCLIPHDAVWMNSTDGGEIPLLYYLNLSNSILPDSVCPYITEKGHDEECPGLDAALASNPLSFELHSMDTLYEMSSIKRALVRNKRALGISTTLATVRYFYPCAGEWLTHAECQRPAGQCTLCPFDKFPPGTCCVSVTRPSVNMEGEFFTHGKTDFASGGHAMLLVGFNDNFVTTTGEKGGFILKNSWGSEHTGSKRGSHSMAYYMQEISHWDELMICPNSRNPRNWYPCATLPICLSRTTELFSNVSGQPSHLRCVDGTRCSTDSAYTYFIKNYTMGVGDDMVNMCFFEHLPAKNQSREFCMGPLVLDQYAEIFEPKEIRSDDPDRCGFYFFPYELLTAWWARFQDGWATDFDIEWLPQSYLSNADKYPQYDYSLLKNSTKLQDSYEFSGPFPYKPFKNLKHTKNEFSYMKNQDAGASIANDDPRPRRHQRERQGSPRSPPAIGRENNYARYQGRRERPISDRTFERVNARP